MLTIIIIEVSRRQTWSSSLSLVVYLTDMPNMFIFCARGLAPEVVLPGWRVGKWQRDVYGRGERVGGNIHTYIDCGLAPDVVLPGWLVGKWQRDVYGMNGRRRFMAGRERKRVEGNIDTHIH
jgi:hypothetical protein